MRRTELTLTTAASAMAAPVRCAGSSRSVRLIVCAIFSLQLLSARSLATALVGRLARQLPSKATIGAELAGRTGWVTPLIAGRNITGQPMPDAKGKCAHLRPLPTGLQKNSDHH
jgi:hypothetical protein